MQVLPKPVLLADVPHQRAEAAPAPDQPDWLWRGRVPCLDGLRGLSILLVLAAHAARTRGFPTSPLVSDALFYVGPLGVSVFFVISGFLITLLLARECAKKGTLSLPGFYRRRAFRILPAYVAYLFVILAISRLHYIQPMGKDWLIALTYTSSIFPVTTWEFFHTWSLSIEEQFYLVWPFLLLVLGARRSGFAAVGCVGLTLLARVLCAKHWGSIEVDYFTLTRMDCIALGCLLAIVATEPSFARARRCLPQGGVGPGLFAAGGLVLSYLLTTRKIARLLLGDWLTPSLLNAVHYRYGIIANAVNAVLICLVIWSFCRHKERWPGRFLEARPLVALGVLSYSLYLWQQPFLTQSNTSWVCCWPINLLWVGLAATASYFLIEAPFLRMKERWKS